MSLKINFYLESRQGNEKNLPINLLVWFDGLRLKYYTGFRIDGCKREGCEHKKCKTKWNYEDQEVKPNNLNEDGLTASFINKKLNKLKSDAASIYNEYENSKKPLTVEVFRNELKIRNDKLLKKAEKQGVNYYFELYKSLKSISPGRLKQVDVTFRHFTRFLVNDRDINSITHETISLFENYLKEHFENARKNLDQDIKTTLSNLNVNEKSIIQLLHTGAHDYQSASNLEQTIAMSIIIGAILTITHGREE